MRYSPPMRLALLTLLLAAWAGSVFGEDQGKTVEAFDSSAYASPPTFQVGDHWEARWEASAPITMTLLAPDGTVLSRVSCSGQGSLYQPKGGNFRLQVEQPNADAGSSWHISIVETDAPAAGSSAASANPPPVPATSVTPAASTNAAPAVTASTPAAPPSPPPSSGALTDDEARAVVLIKGDAGEGTGFLAKTADGPVVITNIHVIADNPNPKIFATTGEEIPALSCKGAMDRDLAMFAIQDNHYSYLPLATDIKDTVLTGDELIIPGNSEGGEVMLNTKGEVKGVGPEKIEFNNPIYHGNSGGPVFHLKSGQVIAVVEGASRVRPTDDLDRASLASSNSAIAGSMRYFGLRVDNVSGWETYDLGRLLNEATFLKAFQQKSRAIDSYLNGSRYEKLNLAKDNPEEGPPDSKFYLTDDEIRTANDNFHRLMVTKDKSEQLFALREMVEELQKQADENVPAIQTPSNFYSYDQILAKRELEYRQALKTEIGKIGDRTNDEGL